ncbi:hypothetical protein ACFSUK_01165 [Sphingobium scionense]
MEREQREDETAQQDVQEPPSREQGVGRLFGADREFGIGQRRGDPRLVLGVLARGRIPGDEQIAPPARQRRGCGIGLRRRGRLLEEGGAKRSQFRPASAQRPTKLGKQVVPMKPVMTVISRRMVRSSPTGLSSLCAAWTRPRIGASTPA